MIHSLAGPLNQVPTSQRSGTVLRVAHLGDQRPAERSGIQGSGGAEHCIADGFGIEALRPGPPQELIVGIDRLASGIGLGRKPIGAAEDQFADEGFGGPAPRLESTRQMIEQFWVSGPVSTETEIVGAGHQAPPEQVQPDAVDGNARGQWVVGVGQPCGQFAAAALKGRHGVHRGESQ